MTEEFYFLKQNEDGEFEQYEPYITVSVNTEEDYEFMKQAIEKQKPKKPIKAQEHIRYAMCYVCPNCGKTFSGTGIANYCYHCGQRLDWSNIDE
ncbi:hypothetical protein [Ruminococcus sp.]|uniref:hypothetical protein n=1 Tax=Ruminococcus sp. TaxID=41978 RepID=UPI00262055B3|nr:hypothetical protein [Ruminococcus sp.]MDD6988753.1 hypothetical protein [Ruminococcus sp.]